METLNLFVSQICVWIFIGLVLCAAWSDFRDYLIPNRISVGLLLLYPAFVLSSPVVIDWQNAGLIAGGVFLFGLGLFAARLMGGGDVKLLAVCALWAGPEQALPFVVLTATAGGILSFALMMRVKYGWIVGYPGAGWAETKVPYGVAIAAGGLHVASRLIAGAS
jgi:prepilin peptidase CpaA